MHRHTLRGARSWPFIVAAIGALALPGAASAASTALRDTDGTLIVTGDGGNNAITVQSSSIIVGGTTLTPGTPIGGQGILIKDPAGITVDSGSVPDCQQHEATMVVCRNDKITGYGFALQEGDDTVGFTNSYVRDKRAVIDGGPGNDLIQGTNRADVLYGGGGEDRFMAGTNPAGTVDTVNLGDGNDVVRFVSEVGTATPTNGQDVVDKDVEMVDGRKGDDTFLITDTWVAAAALLTGSDGRDRVSFAQRTGTESVSVSLNGLADDGPAGSAVLNVEVEDIIGGNGDDELIGDAERNAVSGGSGNDAIDPGDGEDTVDGGAGGDTIALRDGFVDTAACGDGQDGVVADTADAAAADCETVDRPVQEPPVEEPVNQDPVNQDPVNQDPVNQDPVNQDPVNEDKSNDGTSTTDDTAKSTDDTTTGGADQQRGEHTATSGSESQTASSTTASDRTAPALRLTRKTVKASRSARYLRVPVSCPKGETVCKGTIVLRARSGKRVVTVGKGTFALPGDSRGRATVRLTKAGRKLLARKRGVRVQAVALVSDAAGNARWVGSRFTVKAAGKSARAGKRSTRSKSNARRHRR